MLQVTNQLMILLQRCSWATLFTPLQQTTDAAGYWGLLHEVSKIAGTLPFSNYDFGTVAPNLATESATLSSLWAAKMRSMDQLSVRSVEASLFGVANAAARHMIETRLRTQVWGSPVSSFQAIERQLIDASSGLRVGGGANLLPYRSSGYPHLQGAGLVGPFAETLEVEVTQLTQPPPCLIRCNVGAQCM